MVRKHDTAYRSKHKKRIKADVIILGCSLPGIVTAHKLMKRFGDTMDIVVLDLVGPARESSRMNVAFQETEKEKEYDEDESPEQISYQEYDKTARQLIDNVARYYLTKYAKDFQIPLPDAIVAPERDKSKLHKVFQYSNGQTVDCNTDYHDFEYLGFLEKFELNQYQTLLDQSMRELFQTKAEPHQDRSRMLYYDQTTMEKHICECLYFNTSREIMRTTVRLVCGAKASIVSVLFYLHQCYRCSSAKNQIDGDCTRLREKLLGHCRRRLAHKLQQSVADITQAVKYIKEIRTSSNEHVVVETVKGEATYVCNLLAMALKPDELLKIQVEDVLLSEQDAKITNNMIPGRAKKFLIQYEVNFWSRQGYSGDILSIRGPIIWAMERPKLSSTGSTERYAALVGYLMIREDDATESKAAVLEQLVKLYGEEAAEPKAYKEADISDVYVPRCGNYVGLKDLTELGSSGKFLEWATMDVFADGDVAAALEAGHTAYVHLLSSLRPQAQTYEDMSSSEWPVFLSENPLPRWLSHINYVSGMRWSVYITLTLVALRVCKLLMRK